MTRSALARAAVTAALCLLALLAPGAAQAIDVCGNGICATQAIPPENATNCPEDCAAGPFPEPNECSPDFCEDCHPPAIGDKDFDAIPDPLEFDLAHAFFPRILLQHEGVDRDESYLFEGFSIPYTMVSIGGSGSLCDEALECLEVRYGIAFFKDHGDFAGLGSHLGDSEVYAAVLRRTGSWIDSQNKPELWEMIRDFTSAHWGAGSWDSSRVGIYGNCASCGHLSDDPAACNAAPGCSHSGFCTGAINQCLHMGSQQNCESIGACTWNGGCFRSQGCDDEEPKKEFVTLFSAESKHALYHSDDECDSGANWFDDCPNNHFDMRTVKDRMLQNVGNFLHHDKSDVTIKHPDRCHLYDVWGGEPFGESTAYKVHFTTPIGWAID